jgi:REP element-mobilizing transposase RayT
MPHTHHTAERLWYCRKKDYYQIDFSFIFIIHKPLNVIFMKPNTYTQIYIHSVFAVKNRDAVLNPIIRPRVCAYISGILASLKHKSIIVNGISDHIHVLYGMNPAISVSDTVHGIKRSSAIFINQNRLCSCNFSWQEGYGGFSYSKSQLDSVYHYILEQEMHHKKKTFREEYIEFLRKYEIDYNVSFLFDFFE